MDNQDIKEAIDELGSDRFETVIKGHVFKSHLLDIDEKLSVGRICKQFEDSPAYNTAVKTATFALSMDSIDGIDWYFSINDFKETLRDKKFEKATHFYRTVVDKWFISYSDHLSKMIKKLDEFKKK